MVLGGADAGLYRLGTPTQLPWCLEPYRASSSRGTPWSCPETPRSGRLVCLQHIKKQLVLFVHVDLPKKSMCFPEAPRLAILELSKEKPEHTCECCACARAHPRDATQACKVGIHFKTMRDGDSDTHSPPAGRPPARFTARCAK